jgi:ankyrin repeat protein
VLKGTPLLRINDADPDENLPGNFYLVEGLATPLVVASGVSYAERVEILLQHGAVVDMTGSDGLTPLMAATSAGHMKGMEL